MTDLTIMITRCVRRSLRDPEAFFTSLLLPVILMLLFVYVFGGAMSAAATNTSEYADYVVPGLIVLCAGFGAGTTAVAVATDMSSGIVDRFRSMPIRSSSVLAGHVAASLARNVVSTLLVTAVAIGIGFRPHADLARFAAALGVLLLFVAAVSWLAAAFGLAVRAPEAANGAMFFLMFFCYASSAFVPVRTMPWWLRGFAGNQPATSVTETIRALLLGQPAGGHLWIALAWIGGITAASIAAAMVLFRRRTR
jgi:ABC-2 type transport system permease protein